MAKVNNWIEDKFDDLFVAMKAQFYKDMKLKLGKSKWQIFHSYFYSDEMQFKVKT